MSTVSGEEDDESRSAGELLNQFKTSLYVVITYLFGGITNTFLTLGIAFTATGYYLEMTGATGNGAIYAGMFGIFGATFFLIAIVAFVLFKVIRNVSWDI